MKSFKYRLHCGHCYQSFETKGTMTAGAEATHRVVFNAPVCPNCSWPMNYDIEED